jgi:hypothetical protein
MSTPIRIHDVFDNPPDISPEAATARDAEDTARREREAREAGAIVDAAPPSNATGETKLVGRARYVHDLANAWKGPAASGAAAPVRVFKGRAAYIAALHTAGR